MSIKQRDNSLSSEFTNGTHIARKKRAEQKEFKKKNYKQIMDQISEEEDEDDLEKYVRYIK